MRESHKKVFRRESASPVDADEIRRSLGRRIGLPLLAASLIAAAEIAVLRHPGNFEKPIRATPEPAINTPAFVRPPKPSPDVLMGARIRVG
jgi:hypothetical protein